jgi:hypothetical protein
MKKTAIFTAVCLAIVLGLRIANASDRTGLYALVDKVVFEPNAKSPERIQIWGVFAMPVPNDVNFYQPARRGYLYFSLPRSSADLARKEWMDLNQIAGKRQVVGLGGRFSLKARVRTATEKPGSPDDYDVASGIFQIRSDTDYTPIKSLLDYRDR